jgi:hypothetical protein
MRFPWLVASSPEDNEKRTFKNKAEAEEFCKAQIGKQLFVELTLYFRQSMRPTERFRSENGKVISEQLHHRAASGRASRLDPRCQAEKLDAYLQNSGVSARASRKA